jgi:hypothetical protein
MSFTGICANTETSTVPPAANLHLAASSKGKPWDVSVDVRDRLNVEEPTMIIFAGKLELRKGP